MGVLLQQPWSTFGVKEKEEAEEKSKRKAQARKNPVRGDVHTFLCM
jgi:hypothetical protein